MDQSSLVPNNIITNFSALAIQGSEELKQNITTPLYRQPGYSTNNLNLMQLLSKPIALPSITMDSSFNRFLFPIRSLTVLMNQWMPKFIENFVSPRFNLILKMVIPAHQFAVLKLGAAYDPAIIDDTHSYRPAQVPLNIVDISNSISHRYNVIRALNGTFVEVSSSPVTISLKSDIPINYPMNPIDTINTVNNVTFGGFFMLPITPIRFSESLTSITIRPFIHLADLELTPWMH